MGTKRLAAIGVQVALAIAFSCWPSGEIAQVNAGEAPTSPGRPFRKMSAEQIAGLNKQAEEIAMQTRKPAVVVPHIEKGPVIDGDLKEDVYQKAAKINMVWNTGNEKTEELYGTEVYLLTDPQNLYVAFRCNEKQLKSGVIIDPMETVFKGFSSLRERDQAPSEDDNSVEFTLEPGAQRDKDDYYHIWVNTLGTLYDASDRDEINWDPETQVAVKPHDGHYVYELAIPLERLIPRGKNFPRLWAANFRRLRPQEGELVWNRSAKLENFGTLIYMSENFGTLVFALGAMEQ